MTRCFRLSARTILSVPHLLFLSETSELELELVFNLVVTVELDGRCQRIRLSDSAGPLRPFLHLLPNVDAKKTGKIHIDL